MLCQSSIFDDEAKVRQRGILHNCPPNKEFITLLMSLLSSLRDPQSLDKK